MNSGMKALTGQIRATKSEMPVLELEANVCYFGLPSQHEAEFRWRGHRTWNFYKYLMKNMDYISMP
jgi:hypothetical protein